MTETCKTCRFWERWPGKPVGICRRFPPIYQPYWNPNANELYPNIAHPQTADGDWCGEHQPRESEAPAQPVGVGDATDGLIATMSPPMAGVTAGPVTASNYEIAQGVVARGKATAEQIINEAFVAGRASGLADETVTEAMLEAGRLHWHRTTIPVGMIFRAMIRERAKG